MNNLKITIYISIVLLIGLTSCKYVYAKTFLRVKKSRIESSESLTKYIEKYDIESSKTFLLKDNFYEKVIRNDANYFFKYDVFNADFKRLIPRDSLEKSCVGSVPNIFRNQINPSHWINDTASMFTFTELNNNLLDLKGNPSKFNNLEEYKYYVVFYWSKFTGKLSEGYIEAAEQFNSSKLDSTLMITIAMDKHVYMGDALKRTPLKLW